LDAVAADLQASSADLDLLLHHLVDNLRAVPGLDPVVTCRRSRWRRLVGDLP
jgi:hypothetical protein